MISVLIPALDEESVLAETLGSATAADRVELIVADGGSRDRTRVVAAEFGARVISTPRGRANQMNAAAAESRGEHLLFLHADTRLPVGFDETVRTVLSSDEVAFGAFRLRIDAADLRLRLVESGANWRSRWFGLPYGDQALFMRNSRFRAAGGFREIPIMEDFDLVRRLRGLGRVELCAQSVLTSARRWRARGVIRNTLINQARIVAFLAGIRPAWIARRLA